MNRRGAAGLAWCLCLLTLAVLGAGLALWVVNGFPPLLVTMTAMGGPAIRVLEVVTFALIAIVGLLIALRQPSNPIGWIMLAAVVVLSLDVSGQEIATFALPKWPAAAVLVAALAYPLNVSAALVPVMLVLFPTGRLPSARWRGVLWLAGAAGVLQVAHRSLRPGPLRLAPSESNPFGLEGAAPLLSILELTAQFGLLGALLIGAGSLVQRWRHARGEERLQLRWVACAAVPWAAVFAASLIVPQAWQGAARVLSVVLLDVFVLALATALLKYRLYDIDIVINRAIVYGALAAFITCVYIALVFGIGAAAGATTEIDAWLSLLATVVVAVAFQPLRDRAQRLANRLVYGRRASPYEVLASFSRRLVDALSTDEVLPQMAEAAARGVGATAARVLVYVPGGADRAVAWPGNAIEATFEHTLPVLHQGTRVGDIGVSKPPGEPLTSAERLLLEDLAIQAGPALSNVRLAEELRASRQRLVAAQDAERRRLERDLHDGAQQQLVALAVNVQVAQALLRSEPSAAEALLGEAGGQAREALATLRDLARGIYPPALADRGVAAALEAHLAKACPGVRLIVDATMAMARVAPQVEAAVYFCCLEALQNSAKHAGNALATVRLGLDDGWLAFTVTDRGPGFDVTTAHTGSGLQNMADRLAALDGNLEVRSQPGQGTTVKGRVPAWPEFRAQQDHTDTLALDRVAHNAAPLNSSLGS